MSFHRNGLRELVQAGRRERDHPLTFGEVMDWLRLYRDDSKVLLTNGKRLTRISRLDASMHFDCADAEHPMTAGSLKKIMDRWMTPGTATLPLTIDEGDQWLWDTVDINGVGYLIVKERRPPC